MKWKIFYSDHSEEHDTSVSSEYATPFSITRRSDVQVIIQEDSEHRWRTICGYDYYMWDGRGGDPQWFGGDREGLSSYLRKPGYKCVLIGDMINKHLFRKIFTLAREQLGEKVGFDPDERHP